MFILLTHHSLGVGVGVGVGIGAGEGLPARRERTLARVEIFPHTAPRRWQPSPTADQPPRPDKKIAGQDANDRSWI